MRTRKPVVGIDLGGTNMQIGVVSRGFKVLAHSKRKTKAEESYSQIVDRIIGGIDEACHAAGMSRKKIGAVGIGAPGAVDPHAGVVLEAVNLRWNDAPLAATLRKRMGVPVFLDNDVNVAVHGENKLGSGNNSRNILGVWVGTGVGGGLILNGAMFYGHFLTAGEIGHMHLFPGSPPGSRSLEHNCSRTAVVERLIRLIKSNRKSLLPKLAGGDLENIKSKTIAEAYRRGDPLTLEVVHDAADLLGVNVGSIVSLLSLERVVLGGGFTEALGKPFVERVRASVQRVAFPDRCKRVAVVGSVLKDNAGLLGAAMIAMERMA